jgi:hypothetical protein
VTATDKTLNLIEKLKAERKANLEAERKAEEDRLAEQRRAREDKLGEAVLRKLAADGAAVLVEFLSGYTEENFSKELRLIVRSAIFAVPGHREIRLAMAYCDPGWRACHDLDSTRPTWQVTGTRHSTTFEHFADALIAADPAEPKWRHLDVPL